MNPFALTRKLPDGRSAAGPLIYIVIALTILGLFLYYNLRTSGNPPARMAVTPTTNVDVDKVTNAAANFSDVGIPSTPVPSAPNASPGGDSMDYLKTFRTNAVSARETGEDGELALTPDVTPTPPPITLQATPPPNIDVATLRYKAPTPPPSPVVSATPLPISSGFETNNFLPRGALIPVYFLTTVKTGTLEDMVMLGVAENVIFNHRVQLPFGTRLLGSASAAGDGDRIAINVDTILFPNGDELPISGLAKDTDRGPGVRGYYIPQPLWVQILPYVNNFLAAYLDTLQETFTATTTFNQNGTLITSQQQQIDQFSPQTQLAASASEALRDATQVTMASLNALYKPYIVIPPGTAAFVQLRQATDITRRQVNGSVNNPMPILPGFQNNPIPPSGLKEPGSVSGGNEFNPVTSLPFPTTRGPIPDLSDPTTRRQTNQNSQQTVPVPIVLPPAPNSLD